MEVVKEVASFSCSLWQSQNMLFKGIVMTQEEPSSIKARHTEQLCSVEDVLLITGAVKVL